MTMTVQIVTGKRALSFTNVPAKFEERNYNPCYDTILVPDLDSPGCPETLRKHAPDLVGPMMNEWVEVDGEKYRAMGRYEDQYINDILSR